MCGGEEEDDEEVEEDEQVLQEEMKKKRVSQTRNSRIISTDSFVESFETFRFDPKGMQQISSALISKHSSYQTFPHHIPPCYHPAYLP